MFEFISDVFIEKFNLFDAAFLLLMIYNTIQCTLKGFSLSFISFFEVGFVFCRHNYYFA